MAAYERINKSRARHIPPEDFHDGQLVPAGRNYQRCGLPRNRKLLYQANIQMPITKPAVVALD